MPKWLRAGETVDLAGEKQDSRASNVAPRSSHWAKKRQVQEQLKDELQYSDHVLDVNPNYDDSVFSNSWMAHLEQALRGSITFDQLVAAIERDCNTAITAGMAAKK